MQQTLAREFSLRGIGLHSGADVTVIVRPAPANHGINFVRSDISDLNNTIPAKWNYVVDTTLCTVIGNEDGVSLKTIEHLMAALRGCDIDNAEIEVNGPEIPSLDGSSQFFVSEIEKAGIKQQSDTRLYLKVLKKVEVELDDKYACLAPSDLSEFSGEITYDHPLIQHQTYKTSLINGNFAHKLAATRSFCLLEDVEKMKKMGLIKGGSLDNAIVLEGNRVLNPGGLRFKDEFIRHKILDAVGDLYLAGAPILGAYHGVKCGHALNNALLVSLFSDDKAYTWVKSEKLSETISKTGIEVSQSERVSYFVNA